MVKRDPRVVLGVVPGADPTEIKAAWRRLARENHPDLTGDDPAASRAATRRMAEINDAYAELTRDGGDGRGGSDGAGERADFGTEDDVRRRGGPPRPRPSRPVTARVDTTDTFRPRNQSTSAGPAGTPGRTGFAYSAQPPLRGERVQGEPPRASTPTGPAERDTLRDFRRPKPPTLAVARDHTIEFGKFHGHTLGEIAAFEPSYIDWITTTVTRDPELVAAARVLRADLDARSIGRRSHSSPARPTRSA